MKTLARSPAALLGQMSASVKVHPDAVPMAF